MSPEEFEKIIYDKAEKDYGIFPPPTDPQLGLDILIHHFLGDDWYSVNPIHCTQINTEAIYEILRKYPYPKYISLEEKIRRRINEWKKKKQC